MPAPEGKAKLPKALAWLIVPLVGLVELGGHFYFSTRAPKRDEWPRLKPLVTSLRHHDEPVIVAPHWAEPNARFALGDALMPLAQVARPDESAFPRAIEVSVAGASAKEVLAGWHVDSEQRLGKFRVRVLTNPASAHVEYDFVDHVRDATVLLERSGQPLPCRWDPAAARSAGGLHGDPAYPSMRHQCPGGADLFVGVTVVEDQEWRGRRCVWAAPPSSGALKIVFRDVPLGKVVRGYGTLPWWIERELRGAPVELRVRVGGDVIGTYTHRDGDGWKRFEMPTGTHAGTRADVEFETASPRGRERQFCFQADTR